MKSGLRPNKHDRRDYDFLKSKKLVQKYAGVPIEYKEINVDAGIWVPNQEEENTYGTITIPPMPYGCTDYAQNDLCIDEDGVFENPMDIEAVTKANASGGTDLRTSLKAVVKLRGDKHPDFFNIRAQGGIDWFDAIYLAILSASSEKRGVSIGTPWYPEFSSAPSIVPIPDFSLSRASWHNWGIKGLKIIDGVPYLIGKPWLGKGYADNGFSYFSRELINSLMGIPSTVAFTLDKLMPGEAAVPVDSSVVQWIVSFIRNLFNV